MRSSTLLKSNNCKPDELGAEGALDAHASCNCNHLFEVRARLHLRPEMRHKIGHAVVHVELVRIGIAAGIPSALHSRRAVLVVGPGVQRIVLQNSPSCLRMIAMLMD